MSAAVMLTEEVLSNICQSCATELETRHGLHQNERFRESRRNSIELDPREAQSYKSDAASTLAIFN